MVAQLMFFAFVSARTLVDDRATAQGQTLSISGAMTYEALRDPKDARGFALDA